jgi:diguanylate cyclase (GGDEF)-like protein
VLVLARDLLARLRRNRPLLDAIVAGCIALPLIASASYLDLFDVLARIVGNNPWHLDDFLVAFLFVGFLGFIYGARRILDLRREVIRRLEAESEARRMALDDALTGLPNRRSYHLRLERLIEHAAREHAKFAVMLIDLDHFKFVNDVHGHGVGDALLMTIAERVSSHLSPDDFVARLGGDEFVIVARSTQDNDNAARLALKVIHAISEPFALGDVRVEVGATIGIAMYPADGTDLKTLTRRADIALYRAKESGRNQAHFFEPAMDLLLTERAAMERALRAAIREERIDVHYQPLVDLATRRVVAFEALARWNDPTLGTVSPAAFIQVAEDSGLITPLSDFLLTKSYDSQLR